MFQREYSVAASREASPVRVPMTNGHNGHHNGLLNEAIAQMNGNGSVGGTSYGHNTEQSDDEYIDTIDDYDMNSLHSDSTTGNNQAAAAAVAQHNSRTKLRQQPESARRAMAVAGAVAGATGPQALEVDMRMHNVLSQLNVAVERMNSDVQQVMNRMLVLERQVNDAVKVGSGRDGEILGKIS